MKDKETLDRSVESSEKTQLESGTYEILQNRLQNSGHELRSRLEQLNETRKEVFGSIETNLIATERVNTENNCVSRDMVPLGDQFIFGYNVFIGLKTETKLSDVFSIYTYEDHSFHQATMGLIADDRFEDDFKKLYKYYRDSRFRKFVKKEGFLYMVFKIGKAETDLKAFKWRIEGKKLIYVDNRSEHEVVFPDQHEFQWIRTKREQYREGKHPHISIEDKIFVETLGGGLTIKVEDNTEDGQGIYAEEVEHKEQRLEDAEIYYAIIGNLIALKIRPFREDDFRYIVYNSKQQEARRVDALKDSCVLLPADHGIIFSHGYYLQTGEFKLFDNQLTEMLFERQLVSPNGEDFLYVFYNRAEGLYLLLSYNLIAQKVDKPILCHGYALFENGELCFFRDDETAKKHHALQIWQTPYTGPNFELPKLNDSYLYKVGNKEIVTAMAEAYELLTLLNKEDSYEGLYYDLIKGSTDLLDSYYWLDKEDAFSLKEPLKQLLDTATSAVDEFDKVSQIKANTQEQTLITFGRADELIKKINRQKITHINDFVAFISDLRTIRGEVISLKDLRYVVLETVEEYEGALEDLNKKLSADCVQFLLKVEALAPYRDNVNELKGEVEAVAKVSQGRKLQEENNKLAKELEMLIDIVSNLQQDDATETTRILDSISAIYANFNQIKASLKRKLKELLLVEGKAEFNAQLKLIDQGVANYLDLCDQPEKCDEYLTKLMVQIEELEGKFSEFDEFIERLSQLREEIYNAFDSRKQFLLEARNKRANTLLQAADRLLSAVKSRVNRFKSANEVNGYFASDLMLEKLRSIVEELQQMGDNVKADDIQSRMKSLKTETLRQLKDKNELFTEGDNLLKFGDYHFTVNTQALGLTMVYRDKKMNFHLTGTNFFEEVKDEAFLSCQEVWEQTLVSENQQVYRSEYLAFQLYQRAQSSTNEEGALNLHDLYKLNEQELLEYVQGFMAIRYNEGYVKGVHDQDAAKILKALVSLKTKASLLSYDSLNRSVAALYWRLFANESSKGSFEQQLKGVSAILKVFPDSKEFEDLKKNLQQQINAFAETTGLFQLEDITQAGEYLFYELLEDKSLVVSKEAQELYQLFEARLKAKQAWKSFEASLQAIQESPELRFIQLTRWLRAFVQQEGCYQYVDNISETAAIFLTEGFAKARRIETSLGMSMESLQGDHRLIAENGYQLHLTNFIKRLNNFSQHTVPLFEQFSELKKQLIHKQEEVLRLKEFKPKVMSSFVRNKLIDKVYLPLIGANLAKQIGTGGENKRTDLMGMLLLISPPGYGKTTLMEYIANRLGIIFMKINGPAIGHEVTALDPAEAPNAGARQELEKLNLSFEMGDNVMIYLDDIQHCNPEFLQKFISLCDAQRKIEGVYKGKSKTYDFRGKKVCVVMAGNPYTESGDKFQIPDMLANRADIYNLGDVIGDAEEVFKLSYIENCLTSHPLMNKLASKSFKDVHAILRLAETGQQEGLEFEAKHSAEELNEYVAVLKKLLKVRDIVLKVNMQYIYSASQAEEYRKEPPFKLQGSYRNMNKMVEKISAIMNEKELKSVILSHYEGESQTLTSGAGSEPSEI
ncbi:DNA repair ATPase [Xanthovirga aplysinae]|uniref:DNA repair ATPase n=1 Tax=Xanthovirga aplysinae TaxID=2529853 RepID=UPI001CA3CD63|nr:DNA repair ATPase [Xanthovirga aplysinae]